MTYDTRVVSISSIWQLLSSKVALIQFLGDAYMYIGTQATPTTQLGFLMSAGEKYINSQDGVCIWVKRRLNGSTQVVIAEEI